MIIPASFTSVGKMIDQKTSAILLSKNTGEAPKRLFQHTNVKDINGEQVAWFGTPYSDGTTQVMDLGKINVLNVRSVIRVRDLTSRPIYAFDSKLIPRVDHRNHWNLRMPPIMHNILFFRLCIQINFYKGIHIIFNIWWFK